MLFPLKFAWKSQEWTGMQWNNFQGELFINKWHEHGYITVFSDGHMNLPLSINNQHRITYLSWVEFGITVMWNLAIAHLTPQQTWTPSNLDLKSFSVGYSFFSPLLTDLLNQQDLKLCFISFILQDSGVHLFSEQLLFQACIIDISTQST